MVEDFIREIDRRWDPPAASPIRLRIIGSTALMLQADYARGTKDSDVVRTEELGSENEQRLIALAGPGTTLAERHHLYVQVVSSGLLFQRQKVEWLRPASMNDGLRNFDVAVMSVLDVVVSKLKRLNQDDLDDIEAMVERELVTHDALVDAFKKAVDYTMDAKADDRARIAACRATHMPTSIDRDFRVRRRDRR